MSNVDTINHNRDRFRDRDFSFVRSFNNKTKEFRCDICKLKGKKGSTLVDENGDEISIGKTCFHDNFSIRIKDLSD